MMRVGKTAKRCTPRADSIPGGHAPGMDPGRPRDELFEAVKQRRRCCLSTVTQTCHNTSVLRALGTAGMTTASGQKRSSSCIPRPIGFLLTAAKPTREMSAANLLPTLPLKRSAALLGMFDDVVREESPQLANRALSSSCNTF